MTDARSRPAGSWSACRRRLEHPSMPDVLTPGGRPVPVRQAPAPRPVAPDGAKLPDLKLFNGGDKSTWCAGCGDFGILASIKQALPAMGLYPHQVMLVSGIGCGSKL